MTTHDAAARAASPSRSVSGPGTSMDSRQSEANAFCSRPGISSGASLQSQNGYPGMKASGKTMSREPSAATSSMSRIALATVASRSRKTGVACTAAAVYRLSAPVMVTPFTMAIVNRPKLPPFETEAKSWQHNLAIDHPAHCLAFTPPERSAALIPAKTGRGTARKCAYRQHSNLHYPNHAQRREVLSAPSLQDVPFPGSEPGDRDADL